MNQKSATRIATTGVVFLTATVVVVLSIGVTAIDTILAQANASILSDRRHELLTADAPIAISGDNIYIAWWTNKSGNDEVMFRASTDNGATFGDKINLSNTTNTDSVDVKIAAEGGNVVVTWWERNQTANEPVAMISSDNGETFGPVLKLAANGTIGSSEEEGEGEEPEEG